MKADAAKTLAFLKELLQVADAVLLLVLFPFAILALPVMAFAGPIEPLLVLCSIVGYAVIRLCVWSVRRWTTNPAPPAHKVLENN